MVRPMVHSIKHYVQFPFNDIGTGAKEALAIITAVAVQDQNIASEVKEGASIKAVFFEFWLQNSGVDGTFIATITKDPEGSAGPTFAEHSALMTYNNKKNVLWSSEGLTSNDGVSGPVNIIRGWVKIPKSKQRFGLGDRLNMVISNVSAGDLHRCGMTTYKEYS